MFYARKEIYFLEIIIKKNRCYVANVANKYLSIPEYQNKVFRIRVVKNMKINYNCYGFETSFIEDLK